MINPLFTTMLTGLPPGTTAPADVRTATPAASPGLNALLARARATTPATASTARSAKSPTAQPTGRTAQLRPGSNAALLASAPLLDAKRQSGMYAAAAAAGARARAQAGSTGY